MVRAAMSGEGRRPDGFQPDDSEQRRFANDAWSIPSYILSGMLVYGGIGWLLGRWLGTTALFPIGVVFGLLFAMFLVYLRFGRQS
jgi:F0F1-type ATP synthase assembly protein I